jgi:hypothetical protein
MQAVKRMARPWLALALLLGCAGPSRLAERSQDKLAMGEHWRAWELATRALDRAPGNARARAAAEAAAASIAADWERRIHALAELDSLEAAEQALGFADFRAAAARYATVPVGAGWARDEHALRRAAARTHYQRGVGALGSSRPKKAHLHFSEAERFVPGYLDAARLAARTYERGLTRVAFVPFRSATGDAFFGREVAAAWRDDLARSLAPLAARFTRVVGGEGLEEAMTLSQLRGVSREDAVRLGRKAGVERVIWGTIGDVDSDTRLHLFSDVIARRVVEKGADGNTVTRWLEVPIQVVSRVRTATVGFEYEVIATRGGATVARHRAERTAGARVVWTSYMPEGDLDAYALVSDVVRAARPERAREVEARWKSTCGETTTLRQVLEARRTTRSGRYGRDALPRLIAGAAFLFLEDLPPAEDLAFAALAGGWKPLHADLLRLDAIDDVDLGVALGPEPR